LDQKGGTDGRQRHTADQIIGKLREAEVLQRKGMQMEDDLPTAAV
jgi:hypothetical protein